MNNHLIMKLSVAVALIAVGCGLLIAGFITAPPGEIHNSVLVAFGEILTFAGAVFGMQYHYKSEFIRLKDSSLKKKDSPDSHEGGDAKSYG